MTGPSGDDLPDSAPLRIRARSSERDEVRTSTSSSPTSSWSSKRFAHCSGSSGNAFFNRSIRSRLRRSGVKSIGAILSLLALLQACDLSVGDPLSWLVFYGTAAFGWGLFFSVPGVVSAVRTLSAERRVNALRLRQNELAEEWGTVITGENWKPHEISEPSVPSAAG